MQPNNTPESNTPIAPLTDWERALYQSILINNEKTGLLETDQRMRELEQNPNVLRNGNYRLAWFRHNDMHRKDKEAKSFNESFRTQIAYANTVEECNAIYQQHIDKHYLQASPGCFKALKNLFREVPLYPDIKEEFIKTLQERMITLCKPTGDYNPIASSAVFAEVHKKHGMEFEIPQSLPKKQPAASDAEGIKDIPLEYLENFTVVQRR